MLNPIDGPGKYKRRDGSVVELYYCEVTGFLTSGDGKFYEYNTEEPQTGHIPDWEESDADILEKVQ